MRGRGGTADVLYVHPPLPSSFDYLAFMSIFQLKILGFPPPTACTGPVVVVTVDADLMIRWPIEKKRGGIGGGHLN